MIRLLFPPRCVLPVPVVAFTSLSDMHARRGCQSRAQDIAKATPTSCLGDCSEPAKEPARGGLLDAVEVLAVDSVDFGAVFFESRLA